jgi:hypothetical protein
MFLYARVRCMLIPVHFRRILQLWALSFLHDSMLVGFIGEQWSKFQTTRVATSLELA